MILGIDPGLNGAFVWLKECGEVVDIELMPRFINNKKCLLDEQGILALLKKHKIRLCALEKSQSMPGQGSVSIFNYAAGYGLLKGMLIALGVPFELIPPQTWTSCLHVGQPQNKKPKEKSREVARKLFPRINLVAEGCRVPHEGIIDALLITEFARRRSALNAVKIAL